MNLNPALPPRRFTRQPATLPITLLLRERGIDWKHSALVMDLSQVGARVFSQVPLSPGQQLSVCPSEGARFAIPGRVVWARLAESDSGHEAGVEFLPSAVTA